VAERKRPDSNRRGPASRPGAPSRGRSRPAPARSREPRRSSLRDQAKSVRRNFTEPIRRVIAASIAQQNEQRFGLSARRAAILAGLVCVLTLTIAGPVRTYFAQRTEMKQLAASEKALRAQIAELEGQKVKLADPVFVAAQARERLGFVMPGDIPYQVQLPPGAVPEGQTGSNSGPVNTGDPWYTSLWHTIADTPHGPPPAAPLSDQVAPDQVPPDQPPVPAPEPPPVPPSAPGG